MPRFPLYARVLLTLVLLLAGAPRHAGAGPSPTTPILGIATDTVRTELPVGGTAVHTLTISNTGGTDLIFDVSIANASPAPPAAAALRALAAMAARMKAPRGSIENPHFSSASQPAMGHSAQVTAVTTPGATTLLIEDQLPWGSNANEAILAANGISFDVIGSSALASTDLTHYRHVIVASVQPNAFYQALAARAEQIDAFVSGGGVLEFHAASYVGSGLGSSVVTLPGGMGLVSVLSTTNLIVDPTHPIVLGVPTPFTGFYASHATFSNLALSTHVIVTDEFGTPNLVTYPFGAGTVIASGQTLEFGYANGYPPGLILALMIPYAHNLGPRWLSVMPHQGTVPPGGHLDLTLSFDASNLLGGDYHALLKLTTNDPDAGMVNVPVRMHVTGVPDIAVAGERHEVSSIANYSESGATTSHVLTLPVGASGDATITLIADGDYGDYVETAALVVEGATIGQVGRTGSDCTAAHDSFPVDAATFAAWAADGSVQAQVVNSFDVNTFCVVNRHTVTLGYHGPADALHFGPLFQGACETRTLEISNTGTDLLHVTSISSDQADFTASPPSVTVAPGTSVPVDVTFCGSALGLTTGTLTIASDDPDHGTIMVSLSGDAVVAPGLEVTPDSLLVDLFAGQTAAQTLTLRNTGGSDLVVALSVDPVGMVAATAHPGSRRPALLTTWEPPPQPAPATHDPRDRHAGSAVRPGTGPANAGLERRAGPARALDASLPVVLTDPAGDVGPVDLLQVRGVTRSGMLTLELDCATSIDPANYAGVVSFDTDQDRSTGALPSYGLFTQDVGVEFEVLMFSLGTGMVDLYDAITRLYVGSFPATILGNSLTMEIPLSALGHDDGAMNFSGVIGTAFGPTDWFPDVGHGTIERIAWLALDPTQGTVAPGDALNVQALFNTTDLLGGDYRALVRVASNAPAARERRVPAHLHVTGAPHIAVEGVKHVIESGQDYSMSGAQTSHVLPIAAPAGGGASFTLAVDGDYGDPSERATLVVEGVSLGSVGSTGSDCTGRSGAFEVDPATFATFVADGQVNVQVINSPDVDFFCVRNRHTVRLVYRGPGDQLDFGPRFQGTCTPETLVVSNRGTDVLHVSLVSADQAAYTVSPSSFALVPGASQSLVVVFCPTDLGTILGTLSIVSDDPAHGTVQVALRGESLVPPEIAVDPSSLHADLLTGETADRVLTLSNHGGSPLNYQLEVAYDPGPQPAHAGTSRPNRPSSAATPPAHSVLEGRWGAPYSAPASHTVAPGSARAQAGSLPPVIQDPLGDGGPVDVVRVNGLSSGGMVEMEVVLSTPLDPYNFGGAISLDTDQNPATGSFPVFGNGLQDIGAEFAVYFFALPYGHVDVYTTVSGFYMGSFPVTLGPNSLRFALPLASLGGDDGNMDVAGTVGTANGPTEWFPDAGHGTIRALNWLAVAPMTGSIPAGGSSELHVRFDAGGLFGGDYLARLLIASNDPRTPTLPVPMSMHVTGAPDIVLSSVALDFGPQFVGVSRSLPLEVSNRGTDLLTVSSIASDDPQFVPDQTSLSLAPGESATIMVTYTPAGAAPASAMLTVTSNDPDQGSLPVALSGIGLVPPQIAVEPASAHADLLTGGTTVRTLTIRNRGGSDLSYNLQVLTASGPGASRPARPGAGSVARGAARPAEVLGPQGTAPGSSRPPHGYVQVPISGAVAAGSTTLLIEDAAPWGTAANEQVLNANGILFDQINVGMLASTSLSLYGHVIVASDQPTGFYQALSLRAAQLDAYVTGGGVLEFHACGWGANGGDASVVTLPGGMHVSLHYASSNAILDPSHPIVQGVPNPFYGGYASHGSFSSLPPATHVITIDDLGTPTLVTYSIGSGRVIAAGQPLEYNHTYQLSTAPLLGNMIPYAEGLRAHWLTVAPASGIVHAGSSADVEMRFDASGLNGGDYLADVVVSSNDPVRPLLTVPASLHVTGAPDIAVLPPALDFGALRLGLSRSESLVVSNRGTDLLTVSSIASDDAQFVPAPTSFGLAPGASRGVLVTYTAAVAGPVSATLTLTSNDPDHGSLAVALTAEGLTLPEIRVAPTSFNEYGQVGDLKRALLTITNRGGSPLYWQIGIRSGPAGSVLCSSPAVGSAAGPRPKLAEPPSNAAPARDLLQVFAPQDLAGDRVQARKASPGRDARATGGAASLSLEAVKQAFDAGSALVTAQIPNRFNFTEGVSGSSILDGNHDMYDGGNFLSFNQGTAIAYSDGVIADLAPAGVAGRYFTRKVPGMFLFAAEIDGASTFEISGNLGADGSGFVDGVVLQTTVNNTPYLGFVKRVSNAFGDPSVNHLVIVRDGPGLGQQFALNTDNDFHQITGLQGTIRLYDLLFAGENGFYIDDYAMLQIMNQFLGLYGGWLAVDPSGGAVPPRSHQDVIVTFDARGLDPGVYQQSLLVFNNDPLNPLVTVPVTFNVDIVTAVALSLVSADAGPGVAKLTWLAAGSAGTAGTVYRREGSEPWVSVGDVAADGLGYLRFEDRAVAAGHTYGYRFGLSGAEQFTPEVLVRIPEALVFAFHGARPNPARGELHVAFTLPDEAPATLDLLDLAGRRVATMPVGALGPGDHVVSLGGTQALAEGIYLLRFTRLGHSFVTKAAVMH